MSTINSIDDFLSHSGSSSGGKYLKGWKKKGSLKLWLHTKRFPMARWVHPVPQLTIFEDRQTRETKKAMFARDLVCWEDENFLKEQYKRGPDGRLEGGSPCKCAMCRMIDVVYQAVADGTLSWTDEIFNFDGSTDSDDDRLLLAGGITNMFGKKDLSLEQKKQLKEAGVFPSEAWNQNLQAKCQYVLALVDNDAVQDGVQIATEAQSVGNVIKAVIKDSRASLGDDEGNPMLNPYCIEITYDEKALMDKKYHARKIDRIKMTPEIEKLIFSDPPDFTPMARPFNQTALRPFLERYCTVELPWDRIFDVPMMSVGGEEREETEEAAPAEAAPTPAPAAAPKRIAPKAPPVPTIPCDKCQFPMPENVYKCAKCGEEYEDVPADEPPAAPPPKAAGNKGKVTGAKLPFNKF